MKNTDYVNGKWRITPRAAESGNYVYKNGDWFPRKREKQKQTLKSQTVREKMHCGAFPLGKIKEFCKVTTLYLLSGALGVSLAINVFLYMEKRTLEIDSLKLLEIIKQNNQLK